MLVLTSSQFVQMKNGTRYHNGELETMASSDLHLILLDVTSQVNDIREVVSQSKANYKRGVKTIEQEELSRIETLLSMKRRQRGDLLRAVDMKRSQERREEHISSRAATIMDRVDRDGARLERAATLEKCFVDIAKAELPADVFNAILSMSKERAYLQSVDMASIDTASIG